MIYEKLTPEEVSTRSTKVQSVVAEALPKVLVEYAECYLCDDPGAPVRIHLNQEATVTFNQIKALSMAFRTTDINFYSKQGRPLSDITYDDGECYIELSNWSL